MCFILYDRAMTRSGLIIEVPAAEAAVGDWRRRLDPQALLGAPPHVTVLFPFMPRDEIDAATLEKLRRLLTEVPPFRVRPHAHRLVRRPRNSLVST